MTRRTGILPRLTFALWWDVPRATLLGRLGAPPQDAWHRPVSHPITGHFTPSAGEPCTSHVPGGRFSATTTPERCDATENDAQPAGCR
jgi:hypothetical protein